MNQNLIKQSEDEQLKGWVFLVSRSQNLGYRTIVAPDFKHDISSLIALVAGGDITNPEEAIYREIYNSPVGDLTLVFRVVETTYEDMGLEGNGIIKDSFGREIKFIEGVVFQGKSKNIQLSEDNFSHVHNYIKERYKIFWQWVNPQSTIFSELQSFEKSLESDCFKLIIQEPYVIEIDYISKKTWKELYEISLEEKIFDFAIAPTGDFLAVRFDDSEQTLSIVPFDARNGKDIKYDAKKILVTKNQPFIVKKIEKFPVFGDKLLEFSEQLIPDISIQSPVSINQNNYICTGIVSTNNNYLKIYDYNLQLQKSSIHIPDGDDTRITALSFLKDDIIICGCKNGNIKLFNLRKGTQKAQEITKKDCFNRITSIAVSNDHQTFATSDKEGNISFWKLVDSELEEINSIPNAHKIESGVRVNSLAFSPDGKILASVGEDDYIVKLWTNYSEKADILKEEKETELEQKFQKIVFSPDGKLLAAGDNKGCIKVWDFKNKKLILFDKEEQHEDAITALAFIPNTQTLVSGSKDKTIKFWDLR